MKKKALFILEDINLSGSPLTALHFIQVFSKQYDIDLLLLCIKDKEIDLARIDSFKSLCKKIEMMNLPHLTEKSFKLFYNVHLSSIKKRIMGLSKEEPYSVVYLNRFSISGAISEFVKKSFPTTKVIFNSLGNLKDQKDSKYFFIKKRDQKTRSQIIKYCDKYIGISSNSFFNGAKTTGDKITIIRDYPDLKLSSELKSYSKKGTIRIGQIGYYCNNKNQLFTLNLLKGLREKELDVTVSFIGFKLAETHNYYEMMINYINENNLNDCVTFLDKSYPKEDFFKDIDILVCPSFTEGVPLTLLEAQYRNVPCIGSSAIAEDANIGGLKVISLDKENEWIEYLFSETFKEKQVVAFDLKKVFKEKTIEVIKELQ